MQILHVLVYELPWLEFPESRFYQRSILFIVDISDSRTSSSYDFCSSIYRSIVKLSAFILSIKLVKLFESVELRKHRGMPSHGENQRVKFKVQALVGKPEVFNISIETRWNREAKGRECSDRFCLR